MKRTYEFISVLLLLLILTSCGTGSLSNSSENVNLSDSSLTGNSSSDKTLVGTSLIKDINYVKGFKVKGLGGTQGSSGFVGTLNYTGSPDRPFWTLAQWSSKYDISDTAVTKLTDKGNGVYRYVNPTKVFEIDTKNKMLTFGGVTSKCYDKPRVGGDPWFHLLIESTFSNGGQKNPECSLSDLKKVQVTLDSKLTKFQDNMNWAADPNVHAAQFLMYLNIQNQNMDDPGFGEMIWFGFPIFDNRYEWLDTSSMFDAGTKALMYGMGNKKLFLDGANFFKDGEIVSGENSPWIKMNIDVLSEIKIAYEVARYKGYLKNTDFEELYISGMNIGWEIPGSYDAEMQIKNLDVAVYK